MKRSLQYCMSSVDSENKSAVTFSMFSHKIALSGFSHSGANERGAVCKVFYK